MTRNEDYYKNLSGRLLSHGLLYLRDSDLFSGGIAIDGRGGPRKLNDIVAARDAKNKQFNVRLDKYESESFYLTDEEQLQYFKKGLPIPTPAQDAIDNLLYSIKVDILCKMNVGATMVIRGYEVCADAIGVIHDSVKDPITGITLTLDIGRAHLRTVFAYSLLYGIEDGE